jgi:putative copper resistance protein D
MSPLPPFTSGRFISTWHFDPWVTAALVVMTASYLAGMRAAGRRGIRWSRAKLAWFLSLGVAVVVIATMSSLAVYSRVLMWPMALQVSLLLTIVPVGIGLGDPLGLVSAALSEAGTTRWRAALHNPVVRFLTFPAVAPILAIVTQFVIFWSGYIGASQHHGWVLHLLQLQLVVTGCLFALPLLGLEALPAWCTQPIRMTFAAIDGLLDAVPGIALMTTKSLAAGGYYASVTRAWGPTRSWDQTIAGGLLLTVAEVVAVPFIAILYVAWIREDATRAKEIDRQLDLEDLRRDVNLDQPEPDSQRPWWETNPGPLADRAARYGWKGQDDG